ncbi:MAG: hypothetical protein WAK56_20425 [Candidatus Sulfotelmatobacter sp.]
MKKTTILNTVMVGGGLALSFFFALGGWAINTNCGIRTPGILVAQSLPTNGQSELAGFGEMLKTQLFVDWIFWFVVLWLLYFLIVRLTRRLKRPR